MLNQNILYIFKSYLEHGDPNSEQSVQLFFTKFPDHDFLNGLLSFQEKVNLLNSLDQQLIISLLNKSYKDLGIIEKFKIINSLPLEIKSKLLKFI